MPGNTEENRIVPDADRQAYQKEQAWLQISCVAPVANTTRGHSGGLKTTNKQTNKQFVNFWYTAIHRHSREINKIHSTSTASQSSHTCMAPPPRNRALHVNADVIAFVLDHIINLFFCTVRVNKPGHMTCPEYHIHRYCVRLSLPWHTSVTHESTLWTRT